MPDHVTAPDQAARDRIANDLGTNFLVEAGAGSGKTHSLAERMASGIARGIYQVDRMAAVTFTRKAAAELRGRFQLALEARLDARPEPAEAARLAQARAALEQFFAGTIHAFCARLLRERPVEADMAPGFVELDEVEDAIARERAWRDFIVRESARGSAALDRLRMAGLRVGDLDHAFMLVCEHEDVTFPPGEAALPERAPAAAALERFWHALRPDLPDPLDPGTTCNVQKVSATFEGRLATARLDDAASLAALLEVWEGVKITKNRWGNRDSRANRVADRVALELERFERDTVAPFLTAWRAWVYQQTIDVLSSAREFYAAERRRNNVVNYVDLLVVTARLLRENRDVRIAFERKCPWLFVDEFQDTDPIQAEVFVRLAGVPEEAGAADWSTVPLRPGALFVVGDPKQSIYRFRRADIDVYSRMRARLVESGGEVLQLSANFRSQPAICEFVNHVFPRVFPPVPSPESPAFTRLEAVRIADDQSTPRVCRLTLAADLDTGETPAAEAEEIATWIDANVRVGRYRYGDMLVLTRNRPRLKVYAAALERAGIPVEVSGAGMFGGSDEIATLRTLLDTLADPLDGPALVGALRGPLFGLSDGELFAYRRAGGRFDLATPLPDAGETPASPLLLDPSCAAVLGAMRQLVGLSRRIRRLPLGAALEVLLEETGLLALAAAGGAKAGDLLQAVDRVRQVAEGGGGLADATDALAEEVREASEVEALPLQPGRRDVVRLMNLHKAKGLEATVVFLADPCYGHRFEPDLRIERDGLLARGWLRIVRKKEDSFVETLLAEPSGWPAHAERERRYLAAEEMRLLYVAATRARDLLVVGRTAQAKRNKAWTALDSFVSSLPELERPASRAPDTGIAVRVSLTERASAARDRADSHERSTRPTWRVESVTEETHHVARASRIRSATAGDGSPAAVGSTADPTSVLLPETPSHRADAGIAWGMLIHALLEHAMRHPAATSIDLSRLAAWVLVEEPDLRQYIPEAVASVEQVMQGPFWTAAHAADQTHVEVPFAIAVDADRRSVQEDRCTQPAPAAGTRGAGRSRKPDARQPSLFDVESAARPDQEPATVRDAFPPEVIRRETVVRGVIDLVYLAGGGWRLVDYKTDQVLVDPRELLPRYGPQVDRYRSAWHLATGERVVGAELYHVRTRRTIPVE